MTVIARKKGGRPKISEETRRRIVELYNENKLTCDEIAKACSVSKSSLHRILSEERRKSNGGQEA